MVSNLKRMGANIKVISCCKANAKIAIEGPCLLRGADLNSFNDHRTAMSMIVAGLAAEENSFIDNVSCIDKSFPDFFNLLMKLKQ